MALYTSDSRDRVRDAVDFVELVSARTDLRRAGVNRYEGLCPFHDERSPSFGIDPTQKLYHCFGCQASGDMFTFVSETEGLDFRGALEFLAERAGIELELEAEDPKDAERRRRRARLLELLGRTAAYYERCLWESKEAQRARDYLADRGLGEEALREFHVGYAPSAWDRVLLASRRGGFSEAELYATGLAQRSQQNGRPYDRFRERIMFPLSDIRGRVLGFGARAMRPDQRPKYLNTSDNDVYHKGQHLYGADVARPHATRAGKVILCEGYTDVIALHQAGMRNAVGLMGTALTDNQVAELARLASTVLLALDADSAGQEAMLRASGLAARRKLELRVVALPAGSDPADLVRAGGPEAMAAAVDRSLPFVRFRVERVLENGDHDNPEGRDRMLEQLRPVFATLPPSAMRMELTQLVSGRLALPESLAETLLAPDAGASRGGGVYAGGRAQSGAQAAGVQQGSSSPNAARASLDGREETERTLLALCIALPELGRGVLAEIDTQEHFTSDLVRRAAAHLREHLAAPGEGLPDDDPRLAALIAELTVQAGRDPAKASMLEVQRLQLEMARIDREIQAARVGRSGAISDLALRRGELKRSFDRAQEQALQESGS
jgi:DNA primase